MGYLVTIVAGFASGIFFRSLFSFGWEPSVFALLLAGIFAAAGFLKPRLVYSLGAAFCLFVALGMMRTAITDSPLPSAFASDLRQRVSYEGTVIADPDVRDANQRVEVRITSAGESTTMLAVAPRSPQVAVGDRVNVSGTLLTPQPFASTGGRVFRYDKYLERDGVRFLLNFAYLRVTESAPWYSLPAALARMKHAFLNGLSATLPEPYASLAGGIVIGGKSGLGKDLQNDFIRSGLVQIIVLSGYNVMVVAEWVMAALALTKLRKRWGALVAAFAILVFVGIAGFSATALRAAVMALIALYARATGRSYAAGRALFVVVFLMLIYNPLYLVFDPGFGLSVVATAGLIWLAPIIETLLSFLKNAFWKNAVATTLAAQIAVLPLLLYDMGLFSIVAIPANILVAPIVPLAMGLSALAGFAGMMFGTVAPLLGVVLGSPAYLANSYLVFIAQKAATLPFAAFTLPMFPFWLVLLAYAALVFIASSKRFSTTLQLRLAKKASM
ncbi:MAG: ComEC/Rec2 family competence protein [Minisyncoccota bacterium]